MKPDRAAPFNGNPFTVAVSGFTSEVGKTTLLCALLRAFPGWEAIKLTRGHYRSCGKDPQMCCVAHLLRDEPVVYSGRDQNYHPGKDTARFWDAGASNVHWVIATDDQVEKGIRLALDKVRSSGVLIEGNSFLRFMDVDFAVMVAREEGGKIKPTARCALKKTDVFYLSGNLDGAAARDRFVSWSENPDHRASVGGLPIYTHEDLPRLIVRLREKSSGFARVEPAQ